MEIGEIITDAINYPLKHAKELLVYIILDIFITGLGILLGFGGLLHTVQSDMPNIVTSMTNSGAVPAFNYMVRNSGAVGIIAVIIAIVISLFLNGYGLDIIKLAINKKDEGPKIDIKRQLLNGIKYAIINFVYVFIPLFIMLILMQLNEIIGAIIGLVLIILFAFALLMAQCRLAKTEKIIDSLNIQESFNDISKVGIVKILAVIVVVFIIALVLELILSAIVGILVPLGIATYISLVLSALIGAYVFFLSNRAIGLMYSDNEQL